jgi:hypothetical protein
MTTANLQWIGWVATALTVASYFFRDQVTLRRVQAVAAMVWMSYGVAIGAIPIIAANVIVASVAAWTAWRGPGRIAPETAASGEGSV